MSPLERTPFSLGEELQTLALRRKVSFPVGSRAALQVTLGTEQLLALLAMSVAAYSREFISYIN